MIKKAALFALLVPSIALADKYSGTITTEVSNRGSAQVQLQSNILPGKTKSALNFKFSRSRVDVSSKSYFRRVPLKSGVNFVYDYINDSSICFERYVTRVKKISSKKVSWYNSTEIECPDGGYLSLYQRAVMIVAQKRK